MSLFSDNGTTQATCLVTRLIIYERSIGVPLALNMGVSALEDHLQAATAQRTRYEVCWPKRHPYICILVTQIGDTRMK